MRSASAPTLFVALLGFIGSACAVTRTHNSAVDHIIKARQAHVTLKSESLALQKRTATILTSFKTLERDLTPHTDSIKSLCYELPTATPQRCAVIGNLINGLLTNCCGSISTCWGGGGGGWIWPIPPPRPSNYWPVPPPWVPGGSCWGAANVYTSTLNQFQSATNAISPVLKYMPQHRASILATVANAHDEFGSLLDGTNGVLPGLTDFVSQIAGTSPTIKAYSTTTPLGLGGLLSTLLRVI